MLRPSIKFKYLHISTVRRVRWVNIDKLSANELRSAGESLYFIFGERKYQNKFVITDTWCIQKLITGGGGGGITPQTYSIICWTTTQKLNKSSYAPYFGMAACLIHIQSCMDAFNLLVNWLNYDIHSFIHSSILSLMNLYCIYVFAYLLIYPFIYSSIHSYIHSCIHSFIRPFVCLLFFVLSLVDASFILRHCIER